MKPFYSIILLWLLCACTSSHLDSEMDRIEELISTDPERAQVELDSLYSNNRNYFEVPNLQARHILLDTWCGYKNYKNESNDSLISIAEQYFKGYGSEHDKMLTLFLHGFILLNRQDFRASMWKYKEAADVAEGIGDHFMGGQIYTHLYMLCSDAYDACDINYAQRALEEYQLHGDEEYILDGEINMGYAYSGHQEYELANVYFSQALEKAKQLQDTFAIRKCYQRRGYIELQKGNPEGAKRYFQHLFATNGTSHYMEDYSLLAIIHAQLNQPDSALFYLNLLKDKNQRWDANRLRYLQSCVQIYKHNKDYQKAFEFESEYQQLRDSIYWQRLSNSVMKENHDFVVGKLERTESRLGHILGFALALSLFLAFLSAYIMLYRRQQQTSQLLNQEKIDHLNEVIQLQAENARNVLRAMKQTEVVGRFRLAIEDQHHIVEKDWKDLMELYNEYLPSFETKLREIAPFNESEWQIIILQKLDFTTNEIALLTFKVKNSISMTSKRLYERYTQQDGGSKEWHDYLHSL